MTKRCLPSAGGRWGSEEGRLREEEDEGRGWRWRAVGGEQPLGRGGGRILVAALLSLLQFVLLGCFIRRYSYTSDSVPCSAVGFLHLVALV